MADRPNFKVFTVILIATFVGGLVAWAGSDGGERFRSIPVFALCGAIAFAVNWVAFIPAMLARTEHFYDLTGGITYLTVVATAVLLSDDIGMRGMLVAGMVIVWALRLSSFLFLRISKAGKDSRFDVIKTRPARFLMAWTLQGLWVILTAACALAIITGGARVTLGPVALVGIAVWIFGMWFEIMADRQKSSFNADPVNKGTFITTGLWSRSRHPNYFGEIVLWTGVAIIALPVLHGWQWVTLISPVFVTFLLTRVSGVPMLEKKADDRWGGQEDYEAYKQRTPLLVPKLSVSADRQG